MVKKIENSIKKIICFIRLYIYLRKYVIYNVYDSGCYWREKIGVKVRGKEFNVIM